MEIYATNVNQALSEGLRYLLVAGVEETSRNGLVLVSPEPVMTIYKHPCERVLFSPIRDANPFFHLMESLWMLAGRNDLEWPKYFNSNFSQYSDDGVTVRGAYGHRWLKHFGYNQLEILARELKEKPDTRRAVLTMWDATEGAVHHRIFTPIPIPSDLEVISGSKDVPCNTHCYFDCRGGKLNMTICCRSNDALWGAYGANAVHFSMLLEYMAAWVGIPVGVMRQFSNNLHIYKDILGDPNGISRMSADAKDNDFYHYYDRDLKPYPLVSHTITSWQQDLETFMASPGMYTFKYDNSFFPEVAHPMYRAWHNRKAKLSDGLDAVRQIKAEDWSVACATWIHRREKA